MSGQQLCSAAQVFPEADSTIELLRFITCGSVDDGKSTLIGRLLHDSAQIFQDQLESLRKDSQRFGTQSGAIDYALLLDGLQAEREQGITIDVAYRYFSTPRRKFIVADTPGHEQYTRNMVTGASTADLAIILIDARKGVLPQTRRHSYLVSLMGITHIVVAINKMDLADYNEERYAAITKEYLSFAQALGFEEIIPIPLCALSGENIGQASAVAAPSGQSNMPWYAGPTLLHYLEQVQCTGTQQRQTQPFRMAVQWVNRPTDSFRGFSGTIASGAITTGEQIQVTSSGQQAKISRIVTMDKDLSRATAGQAITLCLDREIDISRGELLADPHKLPLRTDQFEAQLIWLHEHPLLPGRTYLMKLGTKTVTAKVTTLISCVDIHTLQNQPATTLQLNDIGLCNISTDTPVSCDPYRDNRTTGSFILIDRFSNATVGAGLIRQPLQHAANLHWQTITINKQRRAALKEQQPKLLWFTGLSGSGKSTLANLVEQKLHTMGKHTYILDGDNIRHGLNRDLSFSEADRVENIRRIAEVAKLFIDAGIIVLAAFISPFKNERDMARELLETGEFIEIFVDTPLAVCEQRDPKGLYQKARKGQISNFTGIDSPYERPEDPDMRIDGSNESAEKIAEGIVQKLFK